MNTTEFLQNGLADLFQSDAMCLRLVSRQRDGILEELSRLVPQLREHAERRQTLLRALIEREQLHSTGIGDGIAVPHARNALVGLVEKPIFGFGRHAEGVPFGALDGRPTHLFFLLVAPNVTLHLAMLARLSRILRDPRLRQGLLQAERPERVIGLIRDAESPVAS